MTSGSDLQEYKAEFFRALAHPVRIRLLEVLATGERSVQELQHQLGLDQPIVSQQLAKLRASGIVTSRKTGVMVRYAVRDPLIGELLAVAKRILTRSLNDAKGMLKQLQREERRATASARG